MAVLLAGNAHALSLINFISIQKGSSLEVNIKRLHYMKLVEQLPTHYVLLPFLGLII